MIGNPRVAKEIRVLLPAFALTLLASAFPFLVFVNDADFWMTLLFGFGCILMGVETFGSELQRGTLSLLLSQPVPRGMVWKEKMQVLGATLALSAIIAGIAVAYSSRGVLTDTNSLLLTIVVVPICVFLTAPFWTLVTRNTLAAMVLTVVVPGLMLGVTHTTFDYLALSPKLAEGFGIILMAVYSVTCGWYTCDRFLKLQVVDAQMLVLAREISLPPKFEAFFKRALATVAPKFAGTTAALFRKELRLQQITFLAAMLFCVGAVLGAIAHLSHVTLSPEFTLADLIWAFDFYLYVIVLPLMAGTAAVAEEKSWGVAEWHMTLPPSALRQWLVKIFVALGASLLLGLALPAFVWWAGTNLLALRNETGPTVSEFLLFVFVHLLLASLAIYSGSLSSTSARGMLLAIVIIAVGALLLSLSYTLASEYAESLVWVTEVIRQFSPANAAASYVSYVGVALILCLVQWFAFLSWRWHVALPLRIVQFFGLAFASCIVSVVAALLAR
jgi:hypothetical protein